MIHLHLHSHYSVLDGLGKPSEIVARAKEIGAKAVAITDHSSISSMPEFFKVAAAAGVKPIIGCEFYWVTDASVGNKDEKRAHLTVLAKSWSGVQSIMEKLTLASHQFYRRARLSLDQLFDFKDCIVMSACSLGVLSRPDFVAVCERMTKAYGDDFYLEIMPHVVPGKDGSDIQRVANERAVLMSTTLGVKLVATNDAHYVRKTDAFTHRVLMAIQYHKTINDDFDWPDVYYMRDVSEMAQAFKSNCPYLTCDQIKASIMESYAIAEKCNVVMPKFEVHLPKAYVGGDDNDIFYKKVVDGWKKLIVGKVGAKLPGYGARLEYEIGVIKKLNFVRYFLIVEDIITWARNRGIRVGPARGSAAGSLACYLLGITQVDPIRHGLYFERFLNPDRIDFPDIDVDFQDDRRAEVFEYIRAKYGHNMTAKINTFGKLSAKSSLKDVARVYGLSPVAANMISKQIEDVDSFDTVPEAVLFAKRYPQIVDMVRKLDGTIRQQGVHACGMIVASQPLVDVCVVEQRKDSGAGDEVVDVVNWDKRDCEDFGLLKIDILGLKTLSVIDKALELIKSRRGISIDPVNIPLDDKKTIEAFSRGEGIGVFQFENAGMQSLLRSLDAKDFETVTDTTALFRPGSLNSGQTQRYVNVARGDESESYPHPSLRPILGPTRGVMVYQEQIMRIFNELGGFTWAESDKMRKIIGKKLGKDEFEKHRAHFVGGCANNGIPSSVSEDLFTKMVEFAAYSFNKSHAVAYTMISFWSMYLKVNYPVEFVCGYMHASGDDKIQEMVAEARRLGVTIGLPSINLSSDTYQIVDGVIVPPLGVIKGVGEKAAVEIFRARAAGPFLSVDDMVARVERRTVNKKVVDLLVRAGAFEDLGVVEPDVETREMNYAELLPTYSQIPLLSIEREPFVPDDLNALFSEYVACGKELVMKPAPPFFKSYAPPVMVINNPVKGEVAPLSRVGSQHFLKVIKEIGFDPSNFYYTHVVKCPLPDPANPPKECAGKCQDRLRREIAIVKPKLIVCFASQIADMFITGKKQPMSKLHGKVVFSKQFNCYVLFSYSPQYAYYQEDKVGDQFLDSMYLLRKIFK